MRESENNDDEDYNEGHPPRPHEDRPPRPHHHKEEYEDEYRGTRGNVIMTRLAEDDLRKLDALIDLELFKSRSEAAAYLIREGIIARKDLLEKVAPTIEKIRQLRQEAIALVKPISKPTETPDEEAEQGSNEQT